MNLSFFTKFSFFLVLCVFIVGSGTALGGVRTLGKTIKVASGGDPDIAVDSNYALHLAYVRGGSTYYRKVFAPYTLGKLGPEIKVGEGSNPQIALDSKRIPHIVFGKAHYSFLSGGKFTKPVQAFSGWRKNLIAIDSKDRVYVIADRNSPRDVLVRVYKNGQPIKGPIVVGDDNPGGVTVDAKDVLHITWRVGSTYYNTYTLEGGKGKSTRSPYSSGDFSWVSINPKNNVVNIVYTAAYAKGIYFHNIKNGKWTDSLLFAPYLAYTHEPDDVNPVSATDAKGNTYVSFRGGTLAKARFSVINENGALIDGFVSPIDPELDSNAGRKMTNPNVFSNASMNGAFVTWGTADVLVRSIGFSPIVDRRAVIANITTLLLRKPEKDKPPVLTGPYLLLLK